MKNEIRPKIAVIGGGRVDDQVYQLGIEVGRRIANAGFLLYTGGKGGIMEAASSGARQAGGVVVGILPDDDPADGNQYIDIPVATGMGIGRNIILIRSVDAVVAIDGRYGTLAEIAYSLQLNKPVIGLQTWDIEAPIVKASSPEDVERILVNMFYLK